MSRAQERELRKWERESAGELPIFRTVYPLIKPDGAVVQVQTQLWAKDDADAERLMGLRNMGERRDFMNDMFGKVTPGHLRLPSDWLREGNLRQALHASLWLGMVAGAAKVATPFELLNDFSAIHALGHLLLPKPVLEMQTPGFLAHTKEVAKRGLLKLEAITPGFQKHEAGVMREAA